MDQGITLTPRLLWVWGSLAAVVMGSLGTWATLGPLSVGGGDKDGAITIVLAVIAAVLVATRKLLSLVSVAAALCLVVAIVDWADITSTKVLGTSFGVGWGLVLVTFASVSLLIWSITERRVRRREDVPSEAPSPGPSVPSGALDHDGDGSSRVGG